MEYSPLFEAFPWLNNYHQGRRRIPIPIILLDSGTPWYCNNCRKFNVTTRSLDVHLPKAKRQTSRSPTCKALLPENLCKGRFSLTESSKFSSSHIVRHVSVVPYREGLVAVACARFGSKASSKVAGIFNFANGSGVDSAISLVFRVDSVSDFDRLILAVASVCAMPMLRLAPLWRTGFAFSRCMSLWIAFWTKFSSSEGIFFWNLAIIVSTIVWIILPTLVSIPYVCINITLPFFNTRSEAQRSIFEGMNGPQTYEMFSSAVDQSHMFEKREKKFFLVFFVFSAGLMKKQKVFGLGKYAVFRIRPSILQIFFLSLFSSRGGEAGKVLIFERKEKLHIYTFFFF